MSTVPRKGEVFANRWRCSLNVATYVPAHPKPLFNTQEICRDEIYPEHPRCKVVSGVVVLQKGVRLHFATSETCAQLNREGKRKPPNPFHCFAAVKKLTCSAHFLLYLSRFDPHDMGCVADHVDEHPDRRP
jgi:hypothetical protein